MVWQDVVIMIAGFVFSISLIPQVYIGFKQKRRNISLWASIPTTAALIAVSYAYLSLSLPLAFFSAFLTTIMWALLLLQALLYK